MRMSKVPEPTHVVSKLEKILSVLIGVGCIIALYRLIPMLIFEINPLHHGGDGLIYTTVGRGITQGLVPYKDLFEFKPPGMFLIVALSLVTTKGMGLANTMQAVTEVGIIVILLFFTWRCVREEKNRAHQWIYLGGTFIFSTVLLLHLVSRAGHFQSESIGTFFVLLFAFIVTRQNTHHYTNIVCGSLALMIAIGIKEPFLFVGASVLILLQPWKIACKNYLVTFATAFVIGIVLLVITQYLVPYLTIYLPELLGPRLHYWKDPWWSNGYSLGWIFQDITQFSPSLLCALVVSFIGTTITIANLQYSSDRKGLLIMMSICAFLWWTITEIIYEYVSAGHDELDSLAPTIAILTLVYTSAIYFGYRKYYPESYQQGLSAILKTYGGMFIMGYTISLAGHLPQQFGFGTAFYATMFIVTVKGAIANKTKILFPLFTLAVIFSLLGLSLHLPDQDYKTMFAVRQKYNREQHQLAKIIDSVMSDCGFNRYVIIGEPPVPWGFTEHTPYGPAFSRASFTYPVEWRQPPIPYLQNAYFEHLKETSIVLASKQADAIVDLKDVPEKVIKEFVENFTIEIPSCAKLYSNEMKKNDYLFFFRKNQMDSVQKK